jgi:hypothetical protein
MRDRAEETIQSYRAWLDQFSWSWIATLKLTSFAPSKRRLKILFNAWIAALRNEEGGKDFRWAAVFEPGRMGTNPHFHVLIGGLRNRMKSWEARWTELGGEALIHRFDPDQKGILYLLKTTDSDGNLDIDMELPKFGSDDDQEVESLRAEPATTLRVEGINERTSVQDLRRLFEDSARVLGITIHSVGGIVYALVAVAQVEAEVAVKELNQKPWHGKKLWVTEVKSQ